MNFYLDFEATRFSNRIISIGCTNERGATFKTLVKPNKGKVDNFITELTGITKEMLQDAPSPDEAFNAFAEWAYQNSENTAPKYFCYGNSDEDFIDATMRTMSDFKAISFAGSCSSQLGGQEGFPSSVLSSLGTQVSNNTYTAFAMQRRCFYSQFYRQGTEAECG